MDDQFESTFLSGFILAATVIAVVLIILDAVQVI